MKKLLFPFILLFLFSCNKDFDDYFANEKGIFPSDNIENVESIAKEDDLFSYLRLVSDSQDEAVADVGCIEFIYPFLLFRYDDNDTYIDQRSVTGNENFARILEELEDGFSIGLSYPISGNLADGTAVTVDSNAALQQSLETCILEGLEIILGICNEIVAVEDCIWKITESMPEESSYINSFFSIQNDASVIFSVPEEATAEENEPTYQTETGTWIFYFIGADLHTNINFGPAEEDANGMVIAQDSIKSDWNFDWKVNSIDENKIEIEKSYIQTTDGEMGESEELITEQFIIEKECKETSSD